MEVELFEGAIDDGQLLETLEMQIPPRLGEHIVFGGIAAQPGHFEIISVQHLIETRMVEREGYLSPETSITLLRCGLMRLV